MTDEQLLHSLLKTSAHLRRQIPNGDGECAKSGGTLPRKRGFWYILDRIQLDIGISQQTLADGIGFRPQTISDTLAEMENQGLIERRRDKSDGRVTLVFITEKGLERKARVAEERSVFAREFLKNLSPDEKITLYSLLGKIDRPEKEAE